MRKNNCTSVFLQITTCQFFREKGEQIHTYESMMTPVTENSSSSCTGGAGVGPLLRQALYRKSTIAALRQSDRINSCKKFIVVSQSHSECSVSGDQNSNGSCKLRGAGAVLDAAEQIALALSQK